MEMQVTATSRTADTHESISAIWSGSQRFWKQDAINAINSRTHNFYTLVGRRAEVGVVDASPPYLRTYADGYWNDNLLALPIR